jgi:hypothetical protein
MKTLMGLKRHDCRFVLPERVDGLHAFCCAPIARGSYCAEHYAVVWTPARRDWSTEKQAKAADHFASGKVRKPAPEEGAPPPVDEVFAKRGSV